MCALPGRLAVRVDAGKLDRRLIVQSQTRTQDDFGQQTDVWSTLATTQAQRLELRTADVAGNAGRDVEVDAKFLIRYRAGLAVGQRAIVDGTTYVITSIDEPDRRATLVLTVASV